VPVPVPLGVLVVVLPVPVPLGVLVVPVPVPLGAVVVPVPVPPGVLVVPVPVPPGVLVVPVPVSPGVVVVVSVFVPLPPLLPPWLQADKAKGRMAKLRAKVLARTALKRWQAFIVGVPLKVVNFWRFLIFKFKNRVSILSSF
jgi:hypothetical protein